MDSGNPQRTGPFGGNSHGETARHGTVSGFGAHGAAGTPKCDPCKQAKNDYLRAYKLRRDRGYLITLLEAYELLGLPFDRTAEVVTFICPVCDHPADGSVAAWREAAGRCPDCQALVCGTCGQCQSGHAQAKAGA